MMLQLQSNRSSSHDSIKVKDPVAAIFSPDDPMTAAATDIKHYGIFRSSTTRIVLAITSVALLLLSLLGMGSTNGAPNLKDLSDTVMDLTRQLQNLGVTEEERGGGAGEVKKLERALEETEIELAWERQHVHDQKTSQKLIYESMIGQIKSEQEAIKLKDRAVTEVARETSMARAELHREKMENSKLKSDLAEALELLANARATLPAAPGAEDEKKVLTNADLKKLRGVVRVSEYQPGDNIEIIEYEEGGKVALRPGIVSDINTDGTYDLVKLEQSILIEGYRREQFQTYHFYHEGMPALFEEAQEVYVPVTIVRLLPGSFRDGFELHGVYEFTFDRDETRTVREGRAMRMHRYAGIGEIIGGGSLSDIYS